MSYVMTASEFVEKLEGIARHTKTLYVMGCFGAPLNPLTKPRYLDNHPYNKNPRRIKMIMDAKEGTYGFDCVCTIKGVLWGWKENPKLPYGGARYASKGVPDVDANTMFQMCSDRSTDFMKIDIGEALWCKGHIGVYIGNGKAVECTPAWKNGVQVTSVKNIVGNAQYPARQWNAHGKLPWIDYKEASETTKIEPAKHFNSKLTGVYEVNAPVGLHIRAGASIKTPSLGILKRGTKVRNYGYYSVDVRDVKWLYVVTSAGCVGYCSTKYLSKC